MNIDWMTIFVFLSRVFLCSCFSFISTGFRVGRTNRKHYCETDDLCWVGIEIASEMEFIVEIQSLLFAVVVY